MNKPANETKEVREELKKDINRKYGSQKLFAKVVGMSLGSLKGKLNRTKRKNGSRERLSIEDWNRIVLELYGVEFDWFWTAICNKYSTETEEYQDEKLDEYERVKKEYSIEHNLQLKFDLFWFEIYDKYTDKQDEFIYKRIFEYEKMKRDLKL